MTGPPACSSCQRQDLLWQRYGVVAGPGHGGECYWHAKVAALANGGLPRTAPPEPTDNLSRLMQMWDEVDAREYERYQRGIRQAHEGAVLSV